MRTLLTISLIFALGCAKRVPVSVRTFQGVGWIAAEQKPGEFLLIGRDTLAIDEGMAVICKEFICANETVGEALIVQRLVKK